MLRLCFFRQQPANDTLHLRNQTDEQRRVGDIKAGVEHGENDGQTLCLTSHRGVVAYQAADHIDEGIEHAEHPEDAKHVEQQVGQSSTSCLCVGSQRGEVSRCRRTDILAHHQGYT